MENTLRGSPWNSSSEARGRALLRRARRAEWPPRTPGREQVWGPETRTGRERGQNKDRGAGGRSAREKATDTATGSQTPPTRPLGASERNPPSASDVDAMLYKFQPHHLPPGLQGLKKKWFRGARSEAGSKTLDSREHARDRWGKQTKANHSFTEALLQVWLKCIQTSKRRRFCRCRRCKFYGGTSAILLYKQFGHLLSSLPHLKPCTCHG